MKTGNAIVATFFLVMAHIIAIVCFLAAPLLIHYGVEPSILPIDPGTLAIPLWFVYMFIGILFMISGMESKENADSKASSFIKTKKIDPPVKHEEIKPTHNMIDYTTKEPDLSILKNSITPVVIKQKVIQKNDVSDIQKHVDNLFLSRSDKSSFDAKKDDLSILKKDITSDIITPHNIPAVDERITHQKFDDQPPAQQPAGISDIHAEIEKMRNDITQRNKITEQLTKKVEEVESIESP